MRRICLVLVVVLVVTEAGCGRDKDGAGDVTTTTAGPTTTSTPVTIASTTTAPGAQTTATTKAATMDVRDWDGVRFDIGILDRIDRTEDGLTLIVFDRVQLETERGRKSGKEFTEEPIVYGNTDMPFVNDNRQLRTYVADRRIDVLRLANVRQTCADLADPAAPRWDPVTIDRVVDESLWRQYSQVSLTFTPDGHVSRLRLSSSC